MRGTLRTLGILLGVPLLGYLLLSYFATNGHPYFEHTAYSPSREESKERRVYIEDQLGLSITNTIPESDSVKFDLWLDKRTVTRVFGYPGIALGQKEYGDFCVLNMANLGHRTDLVVELEGRNEQYLIAGIHWFILPRQQQGARMRVWANNQRELGTITCTWRR